MVARLGVGHPRVRSLGRGGSRARSPAAPPSGHVAQALDAVPGPGADPFLGRPNRRERAQARVAPGGNPERRGRPRGEPDGRDHPVALRRPAVPRPAHAGARRARARLHRPPGRRAPAVGSGSIPPSVGGAHARHRQADDRARDPEQAGRARRSRMATDERASARGREDRRAHHGVARPLGGRDRRAPRAVRRQGLSQRCRGRRHLARRQDRLRRRCVRHDDRSALLQEADGRVGSQARAGRLRRRAVRPRDRARVPQHLASQAAVANGARVSHRAAPVPRTAAGGRTAIGHGHDAGGGGGNRGRGRHGDGGHGLDRCLGPRPPSRIAPRRPRRGRRRGNPVPPRRVTRRRLPASRRPSRRRRPLLRAPPAFHPRNRPRPQRHRPPRRPARRIRRRRRPRPHGPPPRPRRLPRPVLPRRHSRCHCPPFRLCHSRACHPSPCRACLRFRSRGCSRSSLPICTTTRSEPCSASDCRYRAAPLVDTVDVADRAGTIEGGQRAIHAVDLRRREGIRRYVTGRRQLRVRGVREVFELAHREGLDARRRSSSRTRTKPPP